MSQYYLPVLVFIAVGIFFGAVSVVMAMVMSPKKPTERKGAAYECGFTNITPSHEKFSIRFNVVAILFIIFDVELAFLIPWAVAFDDLTTAGIVGGMIFLLLLLVGFIYEWKKGALEWQ